MFSSLILALLASCFSVFELLRKLYIYSHQRLLSQRVSKFTMINQKLEHHDK